jgi:hypothetical protein
MLLENDSALLIFYELIMPFKKVFQELAEWLKW